jgi:microcystin-dependent protein
MDDGYYGSVRLFGGNFAPRSFALCAGQELPIGDNTALFSVIGIAYGGNGRTTFGLPDLRGRVPVNMGRGAGLSNWVIGQRGGREVNQLSITELPHHNHSFAATGASGSISLYVSEEEGDTDDPAAGVLANSGHSQYKSGVATPAAYNGGDSGTCHVTGETGNTGLGQPFSNVQPVLAMNYIICLNGLYPSRS